MIQRIQSVWLLLASACAFLSLKLPFYSGTYNVDPLTKTFKELTGTENLLLIILSSCIAMLALINIFLYKNRTLQLRLCVLGMLLEAGLIALYYREVTNFINGNYALSALLHGCIMLFFFLAARGISRDSKIIKESNRLR